MRRDLPRRARSAPNVVAVPPPLPLALCSRAAFAFQIQSALAAESASAIGGVTPTVRPLARSPRHHALPRVLFRNIKSLRGMLWRAQGTPGRLPVSLRSPTC
jgi:hypothetical protein